MRISSATISTTISGNSGFFFGFLTGFDDGKGSVESFFVGFVQDGCVLEPDLLGGSHDYELEASIALRDSVRMPLQGFLLVAVAADGSTDCQGGGESS